ncbi:hypothetical protein BJX99DRAFT_229960 [Aspergillus californicus]
MSSYNIYNPFARRESHGTYPLAAYRILAPLSWALVVVIGIFYSIHRPHDISNGNTIWHQFQRHFTAFSVNIAVLGIYWILLLITQFHYLFYFFSKEEAVVTLAANTASHFILNNLFIVAWILLWIRNHFWPAEVILIAHFIHQHVAFWRVRTLPRLSHLVVIAAPYAWTLIALFWNGAVATHKYTTAAEIAANVFIWVIFVIGTVHVFVPADDLLGYSLSFLTLGLAVEQYKHKNIPRQWIFAWVIFAVLLIQSLYLSTAKYSGRGVFFQRGAEEPESSDPERAPLLNDALPGPAATS